MTLPFDGAISQFYEEGAPSSLRKAILAGKKGDILDSSFPFPRRIKKADYEDRMKVLQRQLVRLQADAKATGKRIVVVFEGRDAAGKGGSI